MTVSKDIAIKEARECGISFLHTATSMEPYYAQGSTNQLHAYANRMYQLGAASKELEVVRLKLELENEKRK